MKILRNMPLTLLILVAALLIFAGIVLAFSPGKPKPITNFDGKPLPRGLSEKHFISIGGVKQGMFIQSRDTTNPVLLYLHGGMPEYFLNKIYPARLEELFTVVWWEQRGSGISYYRPLISEPLTLERLIDDALELTNYLTERFGKDKIYLMGHSGGSFIGIQLVAKAPEMFHAYIGISQMTDQLLSEKLASDHMLKQYKLKGNKYMARKLELAAITDSIPRSYLRIRDKAMHELGVGTMHNMNSVITGIFLPSLFCPDYAFNEKIALWSSKARSGVSPFWQDIISTDLNKKVKTLDLPVYFCSGIFDYTVNYNLSKEYLENLKAPIKGFYTFENSAHSPLFEEPDKLNQILREDVLRGKVNLADK